jgi:hypothetical protein
VSLTEKAAFLQKEARVKYVNRRAILYGFGLAGMFGSKSLARRATSSDQETTELAWILAGLTPLGRGGDSLNRTTDYWRAVESWFLPVSSHAVLKKIGADFSLPRLIGNAANYRFTSAGGLRRIAGSRPMWDDAQGDLFTNYLPDIEDFVRKSRARTFLARQASALKALREPMYKVYDMHDIQGWLERHFAARPATMQVYISPITYGWNFTNLDAVTPRLWVPAARAPTNAFKRFQLVRSVFTEVDHNYVNSATKRLSSVSYDFINAENGWATSYAWADYPSPELVLNEYMTWAIFIPYAKDRLSESDFGQIDQDTRNMMRRRGFPKFSAFVDALLQLYKDQPGNLEFAYPALVAAMKGAATKDNG